MRLHYIFTTAIFLAAASHAISQQPTTGITLQNELRLRYEQRDTTDFSRANANDPRDATGRLRLGIRYTGKDGSSLFFQPQFSFQDTHGSRIGNGSDSDPHVHQLYADFKTPGLKWRVGRQELAYADERLLGAGYWLNKGRSWDGAKMTVTDAHTKTDIFGATLGQFDYKTTTPTLAGVYSTVTPGKAGSYDLYLLYKNVALTATTHQSIYTAGMRPTWKLRGGMDAKVEGAYQFGSYGGRPVSAFAVAAVTGYTPKTRIGLRLFAEYDYASGGNPVGAGTYRTFDQLFPTNHAHYGLGDFVGWRNMQDVRIGAQAKPMKKLSVTADGHFFRLADATDFWYGDLGKPMIGASGATLRDATGASGRDLGTEMDFTAAYALTRTVGLAAGYARFMPGAFVRNVNAGKADTSDWFFVQAVYGF